VKRLDQNVNPGVLGYLIGKTLDFSVDGRYFSANSAFHFGIFLLFCRPFDVTDGSISLPAGTRPDLYATNG
jgi:hypothetical protein